VELYQEQARRQSPESVALRVGVIREIGHLQWEGAPRERAARFLSGVIGNDRAYRVRADTIRAIGRVGTRTALDAMYRAVFGRGGLFRRRWRTCVRPGTGSGSTRRCSNLRWAATRRG
jgi:hypothetical protein